MIEKIVLHAIQDITACAKEHEEEFLQLVMKKSQKQSELHLRNKRKELEQTQNRNQKLDTIIQHLYEDMVDGKISEDRFSKLNQNYEAEQKNLTARITELEKDISHVQDTTNGANQFMELVKEYTDIKTLDAEMVREFVDKIYIHEKKRVNGKKVQEVTILWNCIGEFTFPKAQK